MSETLPKHEPATFVAGDTVKWTKRTVALKQHRDPADGWTLTYTLTSADTRHDVTATDNGDGDHLVTIAASASTDYPPGIYHWNAFVAKSGERFHVGSGTLCVEPDYEDLARADARAWCRRVLDAIEAAMEGKATSDQLTFSVQGTSISRMSWNQMFLARDRLRAECLRLERAERMAKGLGHTGRVLVRL